MQWSFLLVTVFSIGMTVSHTSTDVCDFFFTIAAIFIVLICIGLILTIIVYFSLKQNVAERYKLSCEDKIKSEEERINENNEC